MQTILYQRPFTASGSLKGLWQWAIHYTNGMLDIARYHYRPINYRSPSMLVLNMLLHYLRRTAVSSAFYPQATDIYTLQT